MRSLDLFLTKLSLSNFKTDLIELFKKKVTNGMKIIPPNELSDLITKGFVKIDMYGNHIITDKFKSIFIDKHIDITSDRIHIVKKIAPKPQMD